VIKEGFGIERQLAGRSVPPQEGRNLKGHHGRLGETWNGKALGDRLPDYPD